MVGHFCIENERKKEAPCRVHTAWSNDGSTTNYPSKLSVFFIGIIVFEFEYATNSYNNFW